MEVILEIFEEDKQIQEKSLVLPATIGRQTSASVCLKGWSIAKQHAKLYASSSGIWIEDLGALSGTLVNGKRVVQYGPLAPDDELFIGSYLLRVRAVNHRPPLSSSLKIEFEPESEHDKEHDSLSELQRFWQRKIYVQLLETLDLRKRDITQLSDEGLRYEATKALHQIFDDLSDELPRELDKEWLSRQVLNEAIGLGPLEDLLHEPSVSEIMVNQFDQIFVEINGQLRLHSQTFSSPQAVLGVIERIVSPLGRRIDESSPMVDARLKDGSRVNAIIPPIALKGPALTIRKFPAKTLGMDDLIAVGALSEVMALVLQMAIEQRKSVLVSGGTGSGKTTLLNILSSFIPEAERVITIEDAAELRLHHRNLVSLESRPPNLEGRGAILIRDLVRNALRMRPDRIVVGECRGAEALDMLQAMNTGHEGSLTTLHANTPRDAIARLETMVLMAGMDLPLAAIREQIASAVHLIVQQTRLSSGHRVISSIVEVTGIESGRIQLQTLFQFEESTDKQDVMGFFVGTNLYPSLLKLNDERLDLTAFSQRIPARVERPSL